MLVQHGLDLRRVHVEAAADHHVLLAVYDVDIALVIHAGQVARVVGAVLEHLGRQLGRAPVARKDVVATHHDLADLAGGHGLAVVAQDLHIAFQKRTPARCQALWPRRAGKQMVFHRQATHARGRLARAVALLQDGPEHIHGLEDARGRHGGGAVAQAQQVGQGAVLALQLGQQHVDHGGHHEGVGHAVGPHVGDEARGLEAVEQADGDPLAQRRHHLHARCVGDRAHQPQDVAGLLPVRTREELAQLRKAVAEGLHGRLEHAGRARGVVQHGDFVLAHDHRGEPVAGLGQCRFVACGARIVGQQQLGHGVGHALRHMWADGLGALGSGHDQRRTAVGGNGADLGGREPGVERRLDQPGLVAGDLDLDDLDTVGQVDAHAVAARKAQAQEGVGQAVGALLQIGVGGAARGAFDGDAAGMGARTARHEGAHVGDDARGDRGRGGNGCLLEHRPRRARGMGSLFQKTGYQGNTDC